MNITNALTKKLKPCDECLKKKRSITKLLLIARFKEEEDNYFKIIPLDIFKLLLSYANEITHNILLNIGDYTNPFVQVELQYMPCSSNVMCLKHIYASKTCVPPSRVEVFGVWHGQFIEVFNDSKLIERSEGGRFFIRFVSADGYSTLVKWNNHY